MGAALLPAAAAATTLAMHSKSAGVQAGRRVLATARMRSLNWKASRARGRLLGSKMKGSCSAERGQWQSAYPPFE